MTSYYSASFRGASATSSAGDGAGHTPAADSAPGATEHGPGSMASYYGATEHVQDPGATEHGPQPFAPASEMALQEETSSDDFADMPDLEPIGTRAEAALARALYQ